MQFFGHFDIKHIFFIINPLKMTRFFKRLMDVYKKHFYWQQTFPTKEPDIIV